MKKYLFLALFLFFINFSFSQITNTNVIAELKIVTNDNAPTITANVKNATDLYYSLRYVFSVITYDSNNNSSKQSVENLLALDPYQAKKLYQTTISSFIKNKIIILFLVYDDNDSLVAKSRVVLNEEGLKNDTNSLKKTVNTGFEIVGIVVDDTKTKSGKDFYDRFYFLYSYNNIKGNQVVKINEMFSFRRTTRIIISVGDDLIHEFFAYPNEEYIENMAKLSIQRVYKYFESKKKEKLYISQY